MPGGGTKARSLRLNGWEAQLLHIVARAKTAACGAVAYGFLAGGYYVINGAAEHDLGSVQVAFEDDSVVVKAFEASRACNPGRSMVSPDWPASS